MTGPRPAVTGAVNLGTWGQECSNHASARTSRTAAAQLSRRSFAQRRRRVRHAVTAPVPRLLAMARARSNVLRGGCSTWKAVRTGKCTRRTVVTALHVPVPCRLVALIHVVMSTNAAPTAGSHPACESDGDRMACIWTALHRTLGAFQPPKTLNDYGSFESVESPSRHFYERGTALDAQGRLPEALAAFEKAAEVEPTDAAHWNNVGVAAMRQHGDDKYHIVMPSLERALRRDPDNRLAAANHLLASAVSQLRRDGSWGAGLGAHRSGSQRVWCQDDDAAVFELSKGQYKTCSMATAAAEQFGKGERGAAASRAVCLMCPAACKLCPAPEAWVAQWWNISSDYGDDPGDCDAGDDAIAYDDVHDASVSKSVGTGPGGPDLSGSIDRSLCTIERRSAASLSPTEFAKEYSARRVPVLLSGVSYRWFHVCGTAPRYHAHNCSRNLRLICSCICCI